MKKFDYKVVLTCYTADITLECDNEKEAAEGALKLAVAGKLKFKHEATPIFIAMKSKKINLVTSGPTIVPGSEKIH